MLGERGSPRLKITILVCWRGTRNSQAAAQRQNDRNAVICAPKGFKPMFETIFCKQFDNHSRLHPVERRYGWTVPRLEATVTRHHAAGGLTTVRSGYHSASLHVATGMQASLATGMQAPLATGMQAPLTTGMQAARARTPFGRKRAFSVAKGLRPRQTTRCCKHYPARVPVD
jgi:hypothetical protein